MIVRVGLSNFSSPGPEMESKATGYSASVTREGDLGTLPVRDRESYSSSRYRIIDKKAQSYVSLSH